MPIVQGSREKVHILTHTHTHTHTHSIIVLKLTLEAIVTQPNFITSRPSLLVQEDCVVLLIGKALSNLKAAREGTCMPT